MKLHEYMAKSIMNQYGIPVPQGRVAGTPQEVAAIAKELGQVAVKSQVLSGGRGKAGGIKFASTAEEALVIGEELLKADLKGLKIEKVLIEEKIIIDRELYLAIALDGTARKPVLIASAHGGMDIEEVPEEHIVKKHIDVNIGILPFIGREVVRRMGLKDAIGKQVGDIIVKLYKVFKDYDAELAEINPLVISGDKVIAADGKLKLDDEASYRYPEGTPITEERTEREKKAHDLGISYVELEGDIAVMANGAGITMATLDIIQYYGGQARNFMDAGGGAGSEATAKALEILISTQPKVILAIIFGGITRCDDVARAFARVKETMGIPVPVVIRLSGTNEAEGIRILREIGINSYDNIAEAAAKAVELAKAN
ncbi:MAG: ADP-forming succinate--CoA ligase subunit beta [Clostridia bacterium]|nr:ADP-forming succinate--CoA ligase subunit beta [Clostridia bacterium]